MTFSRHTGVFCILDPCIEASSCFPLVALFALAEVVKLICQSTVDLTSRRHLHLHRRPEGFEQSEHHLQCLIFLLVFFPTHSDFSRLLSSAIFHTGGFLWQMMPMSHLSNYRFLWNCAGLVAARNSVTIHNNP